MLSVSMGSSSWRAGEVAEVATLSSEIHSTNKQEFTRISEEIRRSIHLRGGDGDNNPHPRQSLPRFGPTRFGRLGRLTRRLSGSIPGPFGAPSTRDHRGSRRSTRRCWRGRGNGRLVSALGPMLCLRRRRVLLFVFLLFLAGLFLRLPAVGDIFSALHAALLAAFLLLGRVPVRDGRKPVGPLLHKIQSATSDVTQRFKQTIRLRQLGALDKCHSPDSEEDYPRRRASLAEILWDSRRGL